MTLIEQFRDAHARIESGLARAEGLSGNPSALLEQLRVMRDEVLAHFAQKDAFYPSLATQCTEAKDLAGAQLTRIFESNMKVQSAAVQRFFSGLESIPTATLVSSFRTVVSVVRQRFGTEERAIFPLYQRSSKPQESA